MQLSTVCACEQCFRMLAINVQGMVSAAKSGVLRQYIHCKNLRVVLTFYGYLSCTFHTHPVSDWDVPFTMAT